MNKAILERILRMDGHITVAAGRVDDPIYLLKKPNKFDLVMLDVLKPETHGIEIYQASLSRLFYYGLVRMKCTP
jgi:DNA-binding NtrC family response regulator